MDNNFNVIWKGQKVGRIENCMPDMWYLEGKWIADNTPLSKEFESLIATFDAKSVMQDPGKGTRIILVEDDNVQETYALVHSLTDGFIFLRRVFEREAVDWLLKNVR